MFASLSRIIFSFFHRTCVKHLVAMEIKMVNPARPLDWDPALTRPKRPAHHKAGSERYRGQTHRHHMIIKQPIQVNNRVCLEMALLYVTIGKWEPAKGNFLTMLNLKHREEIVRKANKCRKETKVVGTVRFKVGQRPILRITEEMATALFLARKPLPLKSSADPRGPTLVVRLSQRYVNTESKKCPGKVNSTTSWL